MLPVKPAPLNYATRTQEPKSTPAATLRLAPKYTVIVLSGIVAAFILLFCLGFTFHIKM
jgi:hypothetical protein